MTNTKKPLIQTIYESWHKAIAEQKEQGFTLIELLIVIAIIAILASIVIIAINPTASIEGAQNRSTQKQARELSSAITQHIISHGAAPTGITTTPQVLCADGFVPADGDCEITLESVLASDSDGDYQFIAQIPTAANAAQNSLAPENSGFTVSTDGTRYTVAPVVSVESDTTSPSLSSATPNDDSAFNAITANLIMNFDENVTEGTGDIYIYSRGVSTDTLVETIEVTSGQVTITDAQVNINPSSDLSSWQEYYIQIDPTAIKDTSNNSYAGITSITEWGFTTECDTTGAGELGDFCFLCSMCQSGICSNMDLQCNDGSNGNGCYSNSECQSGKCANYVCSDALGVDGDGCLFGGNPTCQSGVCDQGDTGLCIGP